MNSLKLDAQSQLIGGFGTKNLDFGLKQENFFLITNYILCISDPQLTAKLYFTSKIFQERGWTCCIQIMAIV